MNQRLLLLFAALTALTVDGTGCANAPEPGPDPDAPADDDDWTPPEVPEDWDPGFDPPEGITVEEVEGFVDLPSDFPWAAEELSVKTWFGGRRPVDASGRFMTAVNSEGTAGLQLLDPSGAPVWLVAHPESDELHPMPVEVSVRSAVSTTLLMSPGWTTADPLFAEVLLRLFESTEAYDDLVDDAEAELRVDPYALLEPSEELALGMGAVADELLSYVPGLSDEYLAMLQAHFGPAAGGGERAYEAVPAGCVISSPFEGRDTQTLEFQDLDGCPRDMVTFENVEIINDGSTLKIGRVENHAGRPVWIYLDGDRSDYGVIPSADDHFTIVGILGARKLSLPTVSQIVSRIIAELTVSIGTVLGRLIDGSDPAAVLAQMGQRTAQWLETFIATSKEESLEFDLQRYGRSVISVYGMGTMFERGQDDEDLSARHVAPFVHGLLSQFVLPALKILSNQDLNDNANDWTLWESTLTEATAIFDQLGNIFQPGARNHSVAETIYSLFAVMNEMAGKFAETILKLGLVSLATGPNNSIAAAEAELTNLLTLGWGLILKVLAPWKVVDLTIEVTNVILSMTLGADAIARLDWTDKYRVDPKPPSQQPPGTPEEVPAEPPVCEVTEPTSGELPAGDFFVLGRSFGAGGLARFRWDSAGEAVEQLDAASAEQAPTWGELFAIEGGGPRGFDVGGETGDNAFVALDSGTLAVIDLFGDDESERDSDRDASTTDTGGAPSGVTRLSPGSEPRGVHAFHKYPFVAVATETEVVIYDSVLLKETARFGPDVLDLRPELGSPGEYLDRPYDISTTPDDATMFVSLPGTFLNSGNRVVILDLQAFLRDRSVLPTRIDPYPDSEVENVLSLGEQSSDPQWLELSPDGTRIAVTLRDIDRIGILSTCYGQGSDCLPGIFDGHPGSITAQFLTSNLYFESSYNSVSVAWADDTTLFAAWDFGHGRLEGNGVVRRCSLEYGVQGCDAPSADDCAAAPEGVVPYGQCGHEVGIEGRPRGLAVFGTETARRVAVVDDQGWVSVLRDELFDSSYCFVGTDTPPNPSPDGTGGCVEDWGGMEMRAVSCTDTDGDDGTISPNISPVDLGTVGGAGLRPFVRGPREPLVEDDELPVQSELTLQVTELEDALSTSTPWDASVVACTGGTLEGDLVVTETSDLLDFCSLYSQVEGDLILRESDTTTIWAGSCLCGVGGDLVIEDNEWLLDIEGWVHLAEVGGDVSIAGNENLVGLDGLIGLTEIGGSLLIEDNLQLRLVRGLGRVQELAGDLTIQDNPELPAAEAQELADSIGSIGGSVTVANNGP